MDVNMPDIVYILSYLIMLLGIAGSLIGVCCYNNIILGIIGIAVFVVGAIILGVCCKIDDEPRCFAGVDA